MGIICDKRNKNGKKRSESIKKFDEKKLNRSKSGDYNSEKGEEKPIEPVDMNKLEEYLKNLYNDYYSAKTYFCSNDFKEKELDAIQKIKKILAAQELLKKGKQKEININELPKKITPEYITGYTENERKKKFDFIIDTLKKEREEAKTRLNKKLEEIKKNTKNVNKNDIEAFKEQSKKILDVEKNKIEEITKDIDAIMQLSNNKYIPVPDYIMVSEEYQIERVNTEIPDNTLKINVSDLSYTKSNPLIIINLKTDDNIARTKEIKGKTKSDINEKFDWLFSEKEFKSLIKGRIEIILQRTYMIKSNKIKGVSQISLKNLKDSDTAGGICKLTMTSGKKDEYIDVTITLRSPIVNKEYDTAYRDVLKIKKIYPQFNINGDNNTSPSPKNQIKISVNRLLNEIENQANKKIESNINRNTEIKKENKNIVNNNSNINKNIIKEEKKENINNINKNENINNINNINIGNVNNGEKIDKKLFKEEELKDVDIIDNLNSLKVLTDRINNLEKVIAKIDGRTPKELLQKKIKMNVKKKNLEQQMNEGEIEPKDYLLLMEHQLNHDVLLCRYLKQENEVEKAKNVYTRIKLLNEEINELKQYIK